MLELKFALRERDEKDVAADVAAHHFHDLGLGHMLRAGNFNLIAGINAETPGVLAVSVKRRGSGGANRQHECCERDPFQTIRCLFGEGSAPGRDPFLSTQKGGFLFGFQIEQTRVV